MNEKESTVFYKSFFDAIKNIPQEEQLQVYNAIFEYSFYEKTPKLNDGIAKALFTIMKPNIDSANARYRASVENGRKGGRPKKENLEKTQQKPKENLEETQIKPRQNLNDNDNDNDNDNVNAVVKYYEQNIGFLNPASAELIFSYLDDLSEEMIIQAIKIASQRNKKNAKYISGILNDWVKKGYKVLADIENENKKDKKEVLEVNDLYEN